MVRLLGSTCALGVLLICWGSVTAWGAGRVWADAVLSRTKVLMSMTIAKSEKVRMIWMPRNQAESFSRAQCVTCTAKIIQVLRRAYGFAFLWISTVLQLLSAAWQIFSSRQSTHLGLRAKHNLRPCQMSWWANRIHLSQGIIRIRSCSIFCGSVSFVSSRRRARRVTWVSTTTPSAILNHVPRTTFAVLRATPGRVSRSFIFGGTCPPKSATIFLAAPTTDFDLFRKKPVERTSG